MQLKEADLIFVLSPLDKSAVWLRWLRLLAPFFLYMW